MTYTFALSILVLSYLLGSIPFGLILTRLAGMNDIREIGSGNIGATNVMRTGRKGLGIVTLLLDAGKGFAAVALARYLHASHMVQLAGLFAVIGHVFPVWLRLQGGKGVATTIGVCFALSWQVGVAVCVIWLLTFALMRVSSLASMLSIGYSSIAAYVFAEDVTAIFCLIMAAFILYTHRGNIKRLIEGTENDFRGKAT